MRRHNRYNNSRDGTPNNWRSFTAITFNVSNISMTSDVTEIRQMFSDYGNVHKIEIETNDNNQSKGSAYVTFKFVHNYFCIFF